MKTHIHYIKELKYFYILLAGQFISRFGSKLTSFVLILWIYQQSGSALSTVLLGVCIYSPSILLSIFAGTLADQWNKKTIMLVSDGVSAVCTLILLISVINGNLTLWVIYAVNIVMSIMDAFQSPASLSAESLLIPTTYFEKASGLQSVANSLIEILYPMVATMLFSFFDISIVFYIDILSFLLGALSLYFFVHIPNEQKVKKETEPFLQECMQGLKYLYKKKAVFYLIIFFSIINLFAYITTCSLLNPMLLARSNKASVVGFVSSAMGIGMLVGSLFTVFHAQTQKRNYAIFLSCALSFILGDILFAFGRVPIIWICGGFLSSLTLPYMDANVMTILRSKTDMHMQGRVFAARNTLQFATMPLGMLIGGILADYVFEPFMQTSSQLQLLCSYLVGDGKGSGMALMFLFMGILGAIFSFGAMKVKLFHQFDHKDEG